MLSAGNQESSASPSTTQSSAIRSLLQEAFIRFQFKFTKHLLPCALNTEFEKARASLCTKVFDEAVEDIIGIMQNDLEVAVPLLAELTLIPESEFHDSQDKSKLKNFLSHYLWGWGRERALRQICIVDFDAIDDLDDCDTSFAKGIHEQVKTEVASNTSVNEEARSLIVFAEMYAMVAQIMHSDVERLFGRDFMPTWDELMDCYIATSEHGRVGTLYSYLLDALEVAYNDIPKHIIPTFQDYRVHSRLFPESMAAPLVKGRHPGLFPTQQMTAKARMARFKAMSDILERSREALDSGTVSQRLFYFWLHRFYNFPESMPDKDASPPVNRPVPSTLERKTCPQYEPNPGYDQYNRHTLLPFYLSLNTFKLIRIAKKQGDTVFNPTAHKAECRIMSPKAVLPSEQYGTLWTKLTRSSIPLSYLNIDEIIRKRFFGYMLKPLMRHFGISEVDNSVERNRDAIMEYVDGLAEARAWRALDDFLEWANLMYLREFRNKRADTAETMHELPFRLARHMVPLAMVTREGDTATQLPIPSDLLAITAVASPIILTHLIDYGPPEEDYMTMYKLDLDGLSVILNRQHFMMVAYRLKSLQAPDLLHPDNLTPVSSPYLALQGAHWLRHECAYEVFYAPPEDFYRGAALPTLTISGLRPCDQLAVQLFVWDGPLPTSLYPACSFEMWVKRETPPPPSIERLKTRPFGEGLRYVFRLRNRTRTFSCPADTIVTISPLCALSGRLIDRPVRNKSCMHVQCLDAAGLVEHVNKDTRFPNPFVQCPHCHKNLRFDDFALDEYMQTVHDMAINRYGREKVKKSQLYMNTVTGRFSITKSDIESILDHHQRDMPRTHPEYQHWQRVECLLDMENPRLRRPGYSSDDEDDLRGLDDFRRQFPF